MAEELARIKNIKDTTKNWESLNPILLNGEIGFELKTNGEIAMKIGDGFTKWKQLKYHTMTMSEITAVETSLNKNLSEREAYLQKQLDNIALVASDSGDVTAEVVQARVGVDGTNHDVLKTRLDTMETNTENYAKNNETNTPKNDMVTGGIGSAAGNTYDATNRVRTIYLPRNISRITCSYGYLFALNVFDSETDTYIGRYCEDGSILKSGDGGSVSYTNSFELDSFKKNLNYRWVAVFKRTDEEDVTVDEIAEHSHFYINRRICYKETFYMDRVRLSSKGNASVSSMGSFTASDFYTSWHTKEMIFVDPGTTIKVSCADATSITIYQFNRDNVLHTTAIAESDEEVVLSSNCNWVRISIEAAEDKISLHKPVEIQWETSDYNNLPKQRDWGENTIPFVFPVPDVHGMRDVEESGASDVSQYNSEIGYSSGILRLPPNYTQTGKPVDVIVACHSSGGYFNFSDTEFYSNYLPFYKYLQDEGYLVVDFWGHSSFAPVTASRPRTYGNPDNMACYEWGIKYVLENFNVNPNGIFVTCKSLGGEVGLNLAFSNTAVRPAAVGMLAPAFNLLRRSLGYTKEERFENAWAWGFEGDTETILGDETTVVDYGTIPAETEAYKAYMKANAHKLMGYNPMWNGLLGANLDTLCDWSFNLGAGDLLESNWSSLVRVCPTPIKIWDAVDDVSTPYSIAKNFVTTLKNGGCMAELRTMPTGTGGHYSVDIGTTDSPSVKVESITTKLGITHSNIPLAYVELVNYFRRFSV